MVEQFEGSVVVDGVDISGLPLNTLRYARVFAS